MKREEKTNAMRILDKSGISYITHFYESDGYLDGMSVAGKLGISESLVFKTLVIQGKSKEYYICLVPVMDELDLKKAARVFGEKSVEMIPVKDITKVTGYVRGGCSPIGMKKQYETVIDQSALLHDEIVISGGRIGVQIQLNTEVLVGLEYTSIEDIVITKWIVYWEQ